MSKSFDFCCTQVRQDRDLGLGKLSRRDASELGHLWLKCKKLEDRILKRRLWSKENREPEVDPQLKTREFFIVTFRLSICYVCTRDD